MNFSDYSQRFVVSESEKAALRIKWDKRHKTRQSAKKSTANSLVISNHHSSRHALTTTIKAKCDSPLAITPDTEDELEGDDM